MRMISSGPFTVTATLVLMLSLFVSGCSSSAKKAEPSSALSGDPALAQKIRAEVPADGPDGIAHRGAYSFINAPGLSADQKQKLMTIYVRVYNESRAIRKEMSQAKSLMFRTVASKSYDSEDVEKLKARIVELDQRRLSIMFQALADVQAVVGWGKGRDEMYKHFYDFEYPRLESISRAD